MNALDPAGFTPAVLAGAGIHALYGSPHPGLLVNPADEAIAVLLARAHRAVRNTGAAAVTPLGVMEVPGQTSDAPDALTVDETSEPAELAARIRAASLAGGVRVTIDVDPGQPWTGATVSEVSDPWADDHAAVVDRIERCESVMILVGPGVITARAVPGLQALANTLCAGVLNTWGAKGVFHWQSRHHWATVGLQEQDFSLGGIEQADLVVAAGIDEREAPTNAWAGQPHVVVAPQALGALAEKLKPRSLPLDMPPLRSRLAAATQGGWKSATSPLSPSRATLHYGRLLAGGGFLAADAGEAGFWVARTFATTELGMVSVPAEIWPGWAVACVAVARLADPLRPALAVVEDRVDEASALAMEFARGCGIDVGVEVWSGEGERIDAEHHERRLRSLVIAPSGGVASLATDPRQIDEFVAAAGPVREWGRPFGRGV